MQLAKHSGKELRRQLAMAGHDWIEEPLGHTLQTLVIGQFNTNRKDVADAADAIACKCNTDPRTLWERVVRPAITTQPSS